MTHDKHTALGIAVWPGCPGCAAPPPRSAKRTRLCDISLPPSYQPSQTSKYPPAVLRKRALNRLRKRVLFGSICVMLVAAIGCTSIFQGKPHIDMADHYPRDQAPLCAELSARAKANVEATLGRPIAKRYGHTIILRPSHLVNREGLRYWFAAPNIAVAGTTSMGRSEVVCDPATGRMEWFNILHECEEYWTIMATGRGIH